MPKKPCPPSVRRHRRKAIMRHIPRQVWVLLEVLLTILLLHYAHIPISDFLHLVKVLI